VNIEKEQPGDSGRIKLHIGAQAGVTSPENSQYAWAKEHIGMKKIVTIIALFSFSLSVTGCYTHSFVSKSEIDKHPDGIILEVTTSKGDLLKFFGNKESNARIEDQKIVGKTVEGQFVNIPLDEVKTVHVEEFSTAKTIWLVAGVGTVAGLLLALANWGSKVVGTSL
jgi:hypothetical protein